MKNKLSFIFTVILFVYLPIFTSCEDKNETEIEVPLTTAQVTQHVNSWLKDTMAIWYYWNETMPTKPDLTQNPDVLFESLLYRTEDRFSFIDDDYEKVMGQIYDGVVPSDIGFEYASLLVNETSDDIVYLVLYAKKNTDAAAKGIKRGDMIIKVNDVAINKSNYTTLLKNLKTTCKLSIFDPNTSTTKDVIVNTHQNLEESPIHLSKILSVADKKIGYIVYNSFTPGNKTQYDKELNDLLTKFNNSGVNELVLDLRYNGGGSVTSAISLASALVPDRKPTKLFIRSEFNSIIRNVLNKNDFTDYFIDEVKTANTSLYTIPHLGDKLSRIYVLTGKYTASASELIINGLRPYIPVKVIGAKTYGKNVGSIPLFRKNDKYNKWIIFPIIMKLYNSLDQSDYSTGFIPDQTINEFEYLFEQFGNPEEPLLAAAIQNMTGTSKRKSLRSSLNNNLIKTSLIDKPGALQMFVNKDFLKK